MIFLVLHCLLFARLGEIDVVVSNQNQLYANATFKKGDLILLPYGQVHLVQKEKVAKGSCVLMMAAMKGTNSLVVQQSRCDFKKGTGHFVPFFWLKEAKEDEEANMSRASVKHGDLTIPCARNTKQVTAGKPLLLEATEPKKKAKK